MKALIIYQDFKSALIANSALQQSAQNTEFSVQWNIRPWRVDMLRFPTTAMEALGEATDAHMIVLAGQRTQSFPFWLKDWLEKWAANRQIGDAALAVIGHRNGDVLAMPAISKLLDFAKQHGLSFIIEESSTGKRLSKLSPKSIMTRSLTESWPCDCIKL
jgi:hypothetical protein